MNRPNHDDFDPWLDNQLRDVDMPQGLQARLERIVDASDEELDHQLRATPIPVGLLSRLATIPDRMSMPRRTFQRRLARLAVAVSLLAMISAAWFGATLTSVADSFGHSADDRNRFDTVLVAEMSTTSLPVVEQAAADSLPLNIPPTLPAEISLNRGAMGIHVEPLGRLAPRSKSASKSALGARVEVEPFYSSLLVDPLARAAALSANLATRSGRHILAQSPLPVAQGVEMPLSQPGERDFLARVGMYPPVLTTERPGISLGVNHVGCGLDILRPFIQSGQLPPVNQVRTEQLLASVARLLTPAPTAPKPTNPTDPPPGVPAFSLNITGGPSPFGGPDNRLIHIGLRARELSPAAHRPTALTVLVDTSSAMSIAGRLATVQRALAELPKFLGPGDHLNLVQFNDSTFVVLEGCGASENPVWQVALASLKPSGESEPVAGLAKALEIARGGRRAPPVQSRVVVLSHCGESWSESTWQRLRPLLDAAGADGIKLDVIPISPVEPLDSCWSRLAQAAKGTVTRAVHPAQVRGLLVESLAGRSQVVLTDARLSVTFPTANVESYRLLGHEPSAVAALQPQQIDSHLYSGQATSVAVEIRPTAAVSGGPDAELATVTLQWRNRGTGQWSKTSRRLMRSQLKGTFDESPPGWRAVALAAGAAEVLRGSPFAEQITLAEIASRWKTLGPSLGNQPEFQEFLTFVEQTDQARQRLPALRGRKP